jgi:hypothetical protein
MARRATKGDEGGGMLAPNRDCQGADVFAAVFKEGRLQRIG